MIIEFLEPELPSRRAWTAVIAIGATAAILFATARVLEARANAIRAQAQPNVVPAVVVHAAPPPPPYSVDAWRAIDRAMLPEAPVLTELEAVAVAGIQLNSIDINMADHMATVELEAASDAELADYLDQLNVGLPSPVWHIQRVAAATTTTAAATPGTPGGSPPGAESVVLVRKF